MSNGQGGYFIARQAATGFPGLGNLESEIYAEASQFCATRGQEFMVGKVEKTAPPYVLGNYPRVEVHFTCLTRSAKPTGTST